MAVDASMVCVSGEDVNRRKYPLCGGRVGDASDLNSKVGKKLERL
jgi:hypothetical protein